MPSAVPPRIDSVETPFEPADFPWQEARRRTRITSYNVCYTKLLRHNWDYPYRDGDNGIAANLKKLVGPDAAYIAVEPFKNDAGKYRKS